MRIINPLGESHKVRERWSRLLPQDFIVQSDRFKLLLSTDVFVVFANVGKAVAVVNVNVDISVDNDVGKSFNVDFKRHENGKRRKRGKGKMLKLRHLSKHPFLTHYFSMWHFIKMMYALMPFL